MSFIPPPQGQPGLAKIEPVAGIRICQIIYFALLMGVTFFAGIVFMTSGQAAGAGKPAMPANPIIFYMGLAGGMSMIAARFIVPGIVVRTLLKKLPQGTPEDLNARLFPIFQTRLIIGMALLEGATFFNLVAYMTERQTGSLVMIGVLVSLMTTMFPTLSQFENWAEDAKRDLATQF